jgi:hypothetical protein
MAFIKEADASGVQLQARRLRDQDKPKRNPI